MRVAVKRGGALYHLHGDHLGSTSLTTRGSAETASRTYFVYGAQRSASGDVKTDRTPEPPHYGLRSGYLSALWSVEFSEPVRFTRQPFPRPRADIILMREEDHLRGRTHRQQRLEQLPFPAAVGSGHGIVNDERAGLAGQMAGQREAQQQVNLLGRSVREEICLSPAAVLRFDLDSELFGVDAAVRIPTIRDPGQPLLHYLGENRRNVPVDVLLGPFQEADRRNQRVAERPDARVRLLCSREILFRFRHIHQIPSEHLKLTLRAVEVGTRFGTLAFGVPELSFRKRSGKFGRVLDVRLVRQSASFSAQAFHLTCQVVQRGLAKEPLQFLPFIERAACLLKFGAALILPGAESLALFIRGDAHNTDEPRGFRHRFLGRGHAPELYDDNNNGRITCAEARREHGIPPVPSSHPVYQYMRDGDSDGVACE